MAVKTKKKTSAENKQYWVSEYLEHYEVSNVNDAEHVNC